MPHGFPGVASSMKRPNSGWKTGAVVSVSLAMSMSCHLLFTRADRSSLDGSSLHVGHAAALAQQLLVAGQGGEDVSLAQRQPHLAVLLIVAHDEIFDLVMGFSHSSYDAKARITCTSSPQSRASLSLPLALPQMASSCWPARQPSLVPFPTAAVASPKTTHLYPPGANFAGDLFGLWPL